MNNLTTGQMIGIGVGGVVVLAGIGGVVYKKNMDREEVEQAQPSRIQELVQMPGPMQHILESIDPVAAHALAATNPNVRNKIQSHNKSIGNYQFMIGEYDKEYNGYRRMTDLEWKAEEMFNKFIQEYKNYSGIFVFRDSRIDNKTNLLLDEYQGATIDNKFLRIECNNNMSCKIMYRNTVGIFEPSSITYTELDETFVNRKPSSRFEPFSQYENLQTLKNDHRQRQIVSAMVRSYSRTPCIFIRNDNTGGKKTRRRRSQKKR